MRFFWRLSNLGNISLGGKFSAHFASQKLVLDPFSYLEHDDEDERREADRHLQQVGPQPVDRIPGVRFSQRKEPFLIRHRIIYQFD